MKIFTIGYGGRTKKEDFTKLIKNAGIKSIIDARLKPDRASLGLFIKAKTKDKGIECWLSEEGINYYSLIELGNIFLDFPDWRERYKNLLEMSGDLLTARLLNIREPFCLLCAEKDPNQCHREVLAKYLKDKYGWQVEHL